MILPKVPVQGNQQICSPQDESLSLEAPRDLLEIVLVFVLVLSPQSLGIFPWIMRLETKKSNYSSK